MNIWPFKQFCLSPNIVFVGIMFIIATIFSLIVLFVFTFIGCKQHLHKQHLRNKLHSSCRIPSTTLRLFNVPANFKERKGFFSRTELLPEAREFFEIMLMLLFLNSFNEFSILWLSVQHNIFKGNPRVSRVSRVSLFRKKLRRKTMKVKITILL